jgi:hypothetical protein
MKAPEDLAQLLRRAMADGLAVTDFHRLERRLEDAFVDVLRKSSGSPAATPPPYQP